MMGRASWRSFQSVMVVTVHVAAIAGLIRWQGVPGGPLGSPAIGVPLAIFLALFLTWPMSRAIASAFESAPEDSEDRCPRCRQPELRPLIRPRGGIFQPVSRYRCAACWTTFRRADHALVELPAPPRTGRVASSGIEFLDETRPAGEEIRFLDEPETP